MTTDEKFNLQINTYPHGQTRHHQATVKAECDGIIHTEWLHVKLPGDEAEAFCRQESTPGLSKAMTLNNFAEE